MKTPLKIHRARFVYQRKRLWDNSEAVTRLKGLPIEIRTQGLGTVVATLLAADDATSRGLVQLIAEWLREGGMVPASENAPRSGDGNAMLKWMANCEPAAYLAAGVETMALLETAKLLAAANEATKEK